MGLKAMGNVTVINVNDGQDGQPGQQGIQGVGVTKVVREYTKSTSPTNLPNPTNPTPSWSETKPQLGANEYLWYRDVTYLDNNTSTPSNARCDLVISGVKHDVDEANKKITDKVWESDISTSISAYDSNTVSTIRDRVTQTETDIDGITSRVSNVETTTGSLGTRMTSAESSITQNADNIALKVSESDVTGNYLIGKINLNSTTATISANRVNITGDVIVSKLSDANKNAISANAISKAEAAIVEQKTLYYLTNGNAPAKPISVVTSTSTSTGVWTTVIPTPKNGYTYYTCTQTKNGAGTYAWIGDANNKGIKMATDSMIANWCSASDSTYINGGSIYANSITTNQLATNAIQGGGYIAPTGTNHFSSQGSFFDLSTGNIITPGFSVDGQTGDAYFNGTINAYDGEFGGQTGCYRIGNDGLIGYKKETEYYYVIYSTTVVDDDVYNYSEASVSSLSLTISDGTTYSLQDVLNLDDVESIKTIFDDTSNNFKIAIYVKRDVSFSDVFGGNIRKASGNYNCSLKSDDYSIRSSGFVYQAAADGGDVVPTVESIVNYISGTELGYDYLKTDTIIVYNGLSIMDNGVTVLSIDDGITLGQANNPRFLIESNGISFVNASDTSLFNIQPDSEKTEYSEKEAQAITYSDENDVPTSFPYTISITDSTASTYLSDETSAPSPEIIITSNGESLQNPSGITATVIDRTRVDITINQQGAETILNFMEYTVDTTYKQSTDTTINSSKTYYIKEGDEYLALDPDSFEGNENPQNNEWYEVYVPEHVSYNSCTISVRYYSVRVNYYSSLMNVVGNIKVDGMSDVIEINNTQWTSQEHTDTFYRAKNNKTGTSVAFGVGAGGVNHGVWSTTKGHWLIYGSDDSYIRIPKATLIGSPSDYGTTTDASRISAGYIQLSKNGGSSYIQIRSGQRSASFTITKDGARGLYDSEKSKWIIYSPSAGNVYIPQKLLVNSEYVQVTNNTSGGAYFKAVCNNKAVSLYSTTGGTRGVYDSHKGKWIIYNVTDLVHIPMKVQMENGATISSGSLAVSSGDITVTDNTNVAVTVICNSKNIALHCNTAGNRGIYHSTGSHWLIYTNDDNKAHIPVALVTGSSITAGASITASANADVLIKADAGAGDIYMHCYNSSTGTKGIYTHNASGTAQSIFQVEQSGTTNFNQAVHFTKHTFVNGGELSVATAHSVDVHVSAVWSDGEYHDLMYKAKSTNDAYFGGAKGLSITTNTYLRGDTVKLQDSSGSAVTSDRNIKKDIMVYDSRYDEFYDLLKPVSYKYIHGHSGRAHCGFIAQEVRDALSSAGLSTTEFGGYVKDKITHRELDSNGEDIKKSDVNYLLDKNINEMHHLIYSEFISLNTWQIQKLKARVSELEEELEKIKKTIEDN